MAGVPGIKKGSIKTIIGDLNFSSLEKGSHLKGCGYLLHAFRNAAGPFGMLLKIGLHLSTKSAHDPAKVFGSFFSEVCTCPLPGCQ